MQLIDVPIEVQSKKDRVEFFVFGDTHIGARNCAEKPMRTQVQEILRHANKPNTHVRVFYGGDTCDYVKPGDIKRFHINCLADWLVKGTPDEIRKRLSSVCTHQLRRALEIFKPLKPYSIGALEGNHEYSIFKYSNFDMQEAFCEGMGVRDLSDECIMRVKFAYRSKKGGKAQTRVLNIYAQHGHGGGRTAGAEPNHLTRLRDEWEDADVVLRGHSHTGCILEPKPISFIPSAGKLPEEMRLRYRYAANWGCWKYSHSLGPSSYESRAAYPGRAMTTIKIVVWPFWNTKRNGHYIGQPKIEMRKYPLI